MIKNFKPVDYIAVIIMIGGLILKFYGADGVVSSIMIMVVAYYFGKKGVEMQIENITNKQNDKLQAK